MSYPNRCVCLLNRGALVCAFFVLLLQHAVHAQPSSPDREWIRPAHERAPAVWGIRGGIVFGLWPSSIEPAGEHSTGGPRGLLRIGYETRGKIYHINYIAIEPVVDGEMEFSEISPSVVDGKWGKLIWAGDTEDTGRFQPFAGTRGTLSHPDPDNPETEQLSVYLFMEPFRNGAHPYLKISLRSDRPEELCLEIFHHENSAPMERCALTATMGNYARLRQLHLEDGILDARELYQGYEGIGFAEEHTIPAKQMLKDQNGNLIVLATTNESFSELSSWPQDPAYYARSNWRYRPFFKLTQYWRKEHTRYDPSLHVRVNARAKYWSGGSRDPDRYVDIPGGLSFENFELRETYYPGQKFYFGLSRQTPGEILSR